MSNQKYTNCDEKKGKTRKKGETVKKIAELLIEQPGILIDQLATKIGVTTSTTRTALNKLKKEPEFCAARHNLNGRPGR